MTLDFVEFRRAVDDDRWWRPPFDWSIAYENGHWWDSTPNSVNDPWYVQVLENGIEVARVKLDDPGGINPCYTGVPEVGDERLEIQYIEVATTARERGIGTQVVRALEDQHLDRRLFAYSEGADRFWASLGWEPFQRPSRPPARTLFIQPPRVRSG